MHKEKRITSTLLYTQQNIERNVPDKGNKFVDGTVDHIESENFNVWIAQVFKVQTN